MFAFLIILLCLWSFHNSLSRTAAVPIPPRLALRSRNSWERRRKVVGVESSGKLLQFAAQPKLIAIMDRQPVLEDDLQHFFALHIGTVLVGQLCHDGS